MAVPTARLVAGLEDVQVYDGEDAVFSLDLSTIIQGTWFLNGEELKSHEPEGQVEPGALRYQIEQKGLQHRLLLRAVQHQHSGALVGFSCPGVQDSAALTIQGWCWWGPGWTDGVKTRKAHVSLHAMQRGLLIIFISLVATLSGVLCGLGSSITYEISKTRTLVPSL